VRVQQGRAALMITVVAVPVGDQRTMSSISIDLAELGPQDLPRSGAQILTGTLKDLRALNRPGAGRPSRRACLLSSLLGSQTFDELMQVAVILRRCHSHGVRQQGPTRPNLSHRSAAVARRLSPLRTGPPGGRSIAGHR
jgi:hypothetical protein